MHTDGATITQRSDQAQQRYKTNAFAA